MSRVLRNGSSRWRGYARAAASLTLLAWLHEGGGCAQQALTAATAAVEPITGAPPAAAGGASRLLEVVFFDVQQGDATLIRTPGGKAI
ncbi:MAG: hypothetical protein NT045_02050, partial [Candidatus Aureabacteria bacterium]|nr:hypothetical protein [Candidatus Auribacterota bacterium]